MRCIYSDEQGQDHDALVLADASGVRDLVIVSEGQPLVVKRVPHRSVRVRPVVLPVVRNKRDAVVQREMTVPQRQPGAFWRD